MKKYVLLTVLTSMCTAAVYTGCMTNIKPIEPIRRVVTWVPDDPASQPSTEPTTTVAEGEAIPQLAPLLTTAEPFPAVVATTTPAKRATTQSAGRQSAATKVASTESAATEAASTASASTEAASTESASTEAASTEIASTQPVAATLPALRPHPGEHIVVKVIDPNQTARYIYRASYDNIWQQARKLLNDTGFLLDREDYRLGVLTTKPLASSQFVEFWKPQQTTFKNALENSINMQQRTVRISISKVPEKPDFYEIAIEVLVERQNNPIETIGGPVFVEGSGFGKAQVSLNSDYAPPEVKGIGPGWYVLGHDQQLEHKLLSELFKHI